MNLTDIDIEGVETGPSQLLLEFLQVPGTLYSPEREMGIPGSLIGLKTERAELFFQPAMEER
jgi:hypothetical protein